MHIFLYNHSRYKEENKYKLNRILQLKKYQKH